MPDVTGVWSEADTEPAGGWWLRQSVSGLVGYLSQPGDAPGLVSGLVGYLSQSGDAPGWRPLLPGPPAAPLYIPPPCNGPNMLKGIYPAIDWEGGGAKVPPPSV